MSFLTRTIQEISPPFVVRIAKLFRRRLRNFRRSEGDGQKDAAWYDASFEDRAHWKRHYSESAYYFLWTVISDRICSQEPPRVLEIGCGSGQLAELLHDRGMSGYCGLDFSPKRIAHARKRCPSCRFEVADVFESDLLETANYDVVLATEFLEHVEADLAVISRIRRGARFLGTVPNFPYTSHVRHFQNAADVAERYEKFFTAFRVDTFLADSLGSRFFLLDGVRH